MEVSLETKFKRYLLYASDSVVYLPGCRLQHKFYEGDNLTKFRSLLEQLDKELVLKLIKWFHDENLSPHPEVLPFVLSECCRNTEWRTDALKLVEEICTTSESFLLFFKFGFEVKPKLGTGRALKRLINNWYSSKDCLDLAGMVGEVPKYRGWSHGDLIRLGHLKSKDPSRSAIYAFAASGYERMVDKYGKIDEAKTIVDYLSKVYHFKRETDVNEATKTVESYMLNVKHVNHIHRKSKKIWRALLHQMDLKDLIKRLHLLSKYGMFRASHLKTWDPQFNPHIFDRMSSSGSVVDSGIDPSSVCLELYRYQNEPSYKLATAIKKNKRTKRVPQISKELVQALEELMAAAFVNIKQNGLNYTVMIDNFKIQSRRCAYRGYVPPNIAAAVIALSLRRAGADVKIVTFEGKTVQPLDKTDYTVASLSTAITGITPGKPNARAIINYLNVTNPATKDTDVFVLLGNTVKYAKYLEVINTHNVKNERKPKFVFCSLCGLNFAGTIEDHENVLVTSGFNDKLFHLINSFGIKQPAIMAQAENQEVN